jgi:K+-sensing histidine kinase KdpD
LHLLDVAENALAAGAGRIAVRLVEEAREDVLRIEIEDDGQGMEEQAVRKVLDPFYTSKPGKRVGLGLPLFAQAAGEAGGEVDILSEPGKGTTVRATFKLSHVDLKPLGDVHQTLAELACAHPGVEFAFEHSRDGTVVARWCSATVQSPTE